jgi:hypothetical protein
MAQLAFFLARSALAYSSVDVALVTTLEKMYTGSLKEIFSFDLAGTHRDALARRCPSSSPRVNQGPSIWLAMLRKDTFERRSPKAHDQMTIWDEFIQI